MSEEIERLNELNRKAYDKARRPQFDHVNFKTMNRLFATKVLSNPLLEHEQVGTITDETVYTVNDFDLEKAEIEGVNEYWQSGSAKILDFASGPGSTSRHFLPYAKELVGVDISQDMADGYNMVASELGIVDKMKGYCMDFGAADQTENDKILGSDFDLAVCSLSYHHMPKVDVMTKRIVSHLKSGGWFFVMDMTSFNGHSSDHGHHLGHHHGHHHGHIQSPEEGLTDEGAAALGVAHKHGIDSQTLATLFQDCGLVNVAVEKGFAASLIFTKEEKDSLFKHMSNDQLKATAGPNGEELYQLKWNLFVVCGQKP